MHMNRVVRFSLAAGAVLLVCACTGDSLNPPPGQTIQASFSDGAHSGNPDFFFLPPIFGSPASNPNFEPNAFNANVRPTVEICELATLPVPPATRRACVPGTPFKTFGSSAVTLDAGSQQYQVNWDTKAPPLTLTKEYRIRVLLGTHELGHADVDPVATSTALKNVVTGEYIGLVNGRTLPIKFRVENGAACDGADCDSKTIDLTQGGSVVLATSGDRVDIPAQTSGQVVTVTVKLCPGLLVDLPKFGNCFTVTADPPLRAPLSPPATVSICSLHDNIPALVHAQQDLVALHRQDITPDATLISALPHSTDFCPTPIGAAPLPPARNWIEAGWRAVRHGVASLFGVRPLHAATAMLDVGGGGETPNFSDFQFALPAKMAILTGAVQRVLPNSPVPIPPAVLVTDADDRPIGGARVHFRITSTNGGSITPTDGIAFSDPVTGLATLTSWLVGDPGDHSVEASGFGIADPRNNGPGEGFDPFAPAVFPGDPDQDRAQPEVPLGIGHLTFSATALAPLLVRPVTTGFASAAGLVLPLTQPNGVSMQRGTAVLLQALPTGVVTWSSSDRLGTIGSVNTAGLVTVVQGNDAPAVARELVVTATGTGATGAMKINSYAFDHFPRFTTLVWRPVIGAVRYDVVYQSGNGCTAGTAVCAGWAPHAGSPATTSKLGYVFAFVGAQPGRWRVVAHNLLGGIISTSEWVYFNYLH
jgi:hypothetical protein